MKEVAGLVYLTIISPNQMKLNSPLCFRRILHRDLKAKNIFLKNNLLKIGDFGVSRLLMGSCDLATTFTGTPYYMSPEALKHQGYDTKSDIWSLGCILHEMCCLDHAFTGHNFLSIVLKIVEGNTPSLPDRYPSKLNTVLHSMLNKDPSLRPSAAEILKIPYIDEQLQNVKCKFTNMALKDKTFICQKEAACIVNAVQKKIHLQTLRELSEVQKMTPRERMRLRKLNVADEKAKKLKQLAEEKYQENLKRMQELRSRNFQQLSIDVLHESDEQTSKHLIQSQPVTALDYISIGHKEPSENETPGRLCMSEPVEHEIPEDPQVAEEYYNDVFESCSETSEEEEENMEVSQTVSKTNQQDSDVEAMVRYLENVLNNSSLGSGTVTGVAPVVPQGSRAINNTMAETKLKRMRERCREKHLVIFLFWSCDCSWHCWFRFMNIFSRRKCITRDFPISIEYMQSHTQSDGNRINAPQDSHLQISNSEARSGSI
uniref:non-specific serine/threonine protein kinase n=1 Tax=Chrysemys picta bellii TaxID=8478 RepID=A0A8C3IEY6_CHRPI|nr:serine/threonine-protein kinase Nek11 isoform X2 [Chrysemys picta bellii]